MPDDRTQERDRLWAKYGRPVQVPAAADVLRQIGKRTEVHPRDVMAFIYPSREAAEAYAAANFEHWGHPTLGSVDADNNGVVSVLDLRPALENFGRAPTDPTLPDEWERHADTPTP